MRHAVHGAESPDQIAGIDGDDFARGEQFRQRVQSDAVVGIIEDGDEDNAVRNIEVRVAGGKAALLEDHGTRHGKFGDGQGLAVLIAGGAEAAKILAQRLVIDVTGVIFHYGYNRMRGDEAGEVVDVAVGVITGDATAEPDSVLSAQIVGENFFVIFARHAGVALLHFAEETFFGGEDGAASVDVDGSAFEDDASVVRDGADFFNAGDVRHQAADFVVVTPVEVFRPGVEAEFIREQASLRD